MLGQSAFRPQPGISLIRVSHYRLVWYLSTKNRALLLNGIQATSGCDVERKQLNQGSFLLHASVPVKHLCTFRSSVSAAMRKLYTPHCQCHSLPAHQCVLPLNQSDGESVLWTSPKSHFVFNFRPLGRIHVGRIRKPRRPREARRLGQLHGRDWLEMQHTWGSKVYLKIWKN